MSTTDRLVELNTRHQVQLERYANGEVIAIVQALRNAINALEDKIRTAPGSKVGMEAYLRELRTLANEILYPVKQSILDRVEPLAVVETNYNIAALTSVTFGAEFAKPSIAAIQRAALSNVLNGKRTRDFLEEVFGLASDQIIYTMRNGIINGLTPAQMLRELVGTKTQNYRDSALRLVYRNTEAVVRTLFNNVGTEAKAATYAANSDVVTGYRIVATLDSRTSPICIALDGKEFELGKGPLPSFHPRCRTTITAIIDPKYRIPGIEGERASRGADGPEPVGAKLTYPTWLRRQPAAFQDDVLGPTRARAFRAGELDLRNLIDLKTLKPLTLDELGLKTVE